MAEINDEFHLKARLDADEKRLTDLRDLQNELAGVDTGRIKRFLSRQARDNRDPEQRDEQLSSELTQLQLFLLNDPVYAALYRDTYDDLCAAETAVEKALRLATERLETARQEMQNLCERAQQLPNGTHIFRDAQGRVWTEHGEELDAEALDGIEWRGNEPSYEDYLARKAEMEQAHEDINALQTYQVDVLGDARRKLTDEANPPSRDEVQQIQTDIREKMPEPARDQMAEGGPSRAAQTTLPVSPDIPKL